MLVNPQGCPLDVDTVVERSVDNTGLTYTTLPGDSDIV